VLTQEGEGWFTSEKVASLADVFVNNRTTMVGQKPSDGKMARIATTGASEGPSTSQGSHGAHGGNFHPGRGGLGGPHSPSKMSQVKCYTCGGRGHVARDCASNKGGNRGGVQGGQVATEDLTEVTIRVEEPTEVTIRVFDGGTTPNEGDSRDGHSV